jgi:hypothetical protein
VKQDLIENFGKRTKNNEGQGTTLVEKNEEMDSVVVCEISVFFWSE